MKQYNVGLVGVGAVGTEMIKCLKERHFPCGKVAVFASRDREETILGETYQVKKATADSFKGLDIVPVDRPDHLPCGRDGCAGYGGKPGGFSLCRGHG